MGGASKILSTLVTYPTQVKLCMYSRCSCHTLCFRQVHLLLPSLLVAIMVPVRAEIFVQHDQVGTILYAPSAFLGLSWKRELTLASKTHTHVWI